jgi:NodT family efflux transporter outer membrane factor (OMF) lipoprotein
MRNGFVLAVSVILLSSCQTGPDFGPPSAPQNWVHTQDEAVKAFEAPALRHWWLGFEDTTLNAFVGAALTSSPDIKDSQAKILEARGNWRSNRATLFPLLTGHVNKGRQDIALADADNYYDAAFDASYEIDLFGQNRNKAGAAKSLLVVSEASHRAVTLSLIAEVSRNYIQYRTFKTQAAIADKNLSAQKKSLDLVRHQKEVGVAPQLDVERAETLYHTTRASIQAFEQQADAAALRLSVLTGLFPAKVKDLLGLQASMPRAAIGPVLMAPADVLAERPDVQAAWANLSAQGDLADSAFAALFPTFTLSGFFGVEDSALASTTQVWSVALGAAATLLDFGRLAGQVDAARAREVQAYEGLRKSVLQAVADVETALSAYARLHEQSLYLDQAKENAQRSLVISEELYKEGEISFLDVLDAQRTANDADSAAVSAQSDKVLALVALYKALGVY